MKMAIHIFGLILLGLLSPGFSLDTLTFVTSVSKFYQELNPDVLTGQQYMSNVNDECWSYWFYYKNPSCHKICPLAGYLHLLTPVVRGGWIGVDIVPENVNKLSDMLSLYENSTDKTPSGNETIGEAVKRINKGLAKRLESCAVNNFKISSDTKVPKYGETPSERGHCAIFVEQDLRNTLILSNCIMKQLEHYEQFRW